MASFAANPGVIAVALVFVGVIGYLWIVNRGMSHAPAEVLQIAQERWTTKQLREEYQRMQTAPTDVRPFLFAKTGRRYVVVGGSGLVGGWIVNHLLLRGEDPAAIRILDLAPPTRPEVAANKIRHVPTDISDPDAVSRAFSEAWPTKVAKKPLTVFHTAAYINPADRYEYCMPIYQRININGTQHILDSARAAGASCLIATSSGSVSTDPINYWIPPWKTMPDGFFQLHVNGDPKTTDGKLSDYGSCYSYSKVIAEKKVCQADDHKNGFRTGCIRPCHAIYGHGVNNSSSVTWDYMRRGGLPTWLRDVIVNFVHAQNVSVGHLAYENTLLTQSKKSGIGGRAFAVTDPGGPIRYDELYTALETLAHPMHPVRFPRMPPVFILLLAHAVDLYANLRHQYLPFLPPVTGDLKIVQPAMLQMCTMHIIFDDSAAKEIIGYDPPITSLEGLCSQAADFNSQVEAKLQKEVAEGKGGELSPTTPSNMPKPPVGM